MANTVKRIWPDSTVVCIASGPSLTKDDCEWIRGQAKVIAVNSSYRIAPWADVLYACDARWWAWEKGAAGFTGLKFALERRAAKWPGVVTLTVGKADGLSTNPAVLNTGKNSGYQAINLAVHLGAKRIVLLGYDMQRATDGSMHWHEEHPMKTPHLYHEFRTRYATLVSPLQKLGVDVINCTRRTALTMFEQRTLEAVFPTCVLEQAS